MQDLKILWMRITFTEVSFLKLHTAGARGRGREQDYVGAPSMERETYKDDTHLKKAIACIKLSFGPSLLF